MICHERTPVLDAMRALVREAGVSTVPCSSSGNQAGGAILENWPSPHRDSSGPFILGFPASRTVSNQYLWFTSPQSQLL